MRILPGATGAGGQRGGRRRRVRAQHRVQGAAAVGDVEALAARHHVRQRRGHLGRLRRYV